MVKRHVGAKTPRGAITRKADQNCEGNQNPMSVAGNKNPGQAAIIARIGPVRD
jgi:hypothetical protein